MQVLMFTDEVHQGLGPSQYVVVIKLFKLVLIDNYCCHVYDDENCKQFSFIDVKT